MATQVMYVGSGGSVLNESVAESVEDVVKAVNGALRGDHAKWVGLTRSSGGEFAVVAAGVAEI